MAIHNVRIAIVGFGFMGRAHCNTYAKIDGARVVALCDNRPKVFGSKEIGGNIEIGAGVVDISGLRHYSDYESLLHDGGFDAIDICLPTHLHAAHATRALESGYHLFCEKPIAGSIAEAEEIVKSWRDTGRQCMIGHCLRFWPAYTEVKKILDSGQFGRLLHIELSRYAPRPVGSANQWMLNSKQSGSASLDMHIHDVDMLLYLCGAPERVRSVGIPDGAGSYSHISTVYTYPDLSALSSGGWNMPTSLPFTMRALYLFEGATIDMDYRRDDTMLIYPESGDPYPFDLPPEDGYYRELDYFVQSIITGGATSVASPDNALRSLRLTLLEIESARRGVEMPVILG